MAAGNRPLRCVSFVVVVAAAVLGGCATPPGAADERDERDEGGTAGRVVRACARPPVRGAAAVSGAPWPADAAVEPVEGYSPEAAEIAGVIGALGPLRRFAVLEAVLDAQTHGPEAALAELRLVSLRLHITDTVLRSMLDVSSVLAEIACENERGDQLRDHLQKVEERRTRRLGLGSIAIGALTAIVSGGLSLANPDAAGGNVAAIVGGTLEASLGATVMYGNASGEFGTERNLLREVWEGPERSALFPSSVWRFLSRPVSDGEGGTTLREVLVAQWRAGERLGPANSPDERRRIALLFGAGGTYTIDDLNAREALFDLLEASVASMHQDLQRLLDELVERSQR